MAPNTPLNLGLLRLLLVDSIMGIDNVLEAEGCSEMCGKGVSKMLLAHQLFMMGVVFPQKTEDVGRGRKGLV